MQKIKFLLIILFASAPVINCQTAMEYYLRGMDRYNQKQYEEAINEFNICLSLDSTAYPAHLFRGLSEQAIGQHTNAITDFNITIKYAPIVDSILVVYWYRAISKNALGDAEGGLSDINYALQINPQDTTFLLFRVSQKIFMKDWESAKKDIDELINIKLYNTDTYCLRGFINIQLKNYDEAFNNFARAIEIDSTYHEAYKHRAELNFWLKNHEKSLADVKKALKYSPYDGHLLCIKGSAEYELGQINEAISDLDLSIANGSVEDISTAFFTRGKCYLWLGNKRSACEDFQKAKELGCPEADSLITINCK